ncbi:MAG: histidine phosphatase family protein [Planctomycetes bacterium]|nr:histidine phosphatase family protein [Planctomycetota bacterium]
MRLTLLRHGKAMDRSSWHGEDADRPLTREGEEQAERVCKALKELIRADEIWTSPWVRARHTAEIASAAWKLPLREVAWMAGEAASAQERIDELPSDSDVVLVGHEPDLGLLAGALLGGISLQLKKSGIAVLDGKPALAEMRLVSLLTPKHVLGLSRP